MRKTVRADGPWRLEVLSGVVRLVQGDRQIVPEARTAALLALLAFEGPTPRDRAASLLWPDREPSRSRGNLRQLLFRLRAEADVVTGDPLALRPDVHVDAHDVDVDHSTPDVIPSFLDALDAPGELGERLAEGFERTRARLRTALLARATRHEAAGELPEAVDAARRLVALDALDEEAARLAMRLQLEAGRPADALVGFSRLRTALDRVLGIGPSADTLALAQRAAAAASDPLEAGPLRAGASAPASSAVPVARRAEAGGWLLEGADVLRAAAHALEPGPERGRMLIQLAWLEHQLGRQGAARLAAETGLSLLEEGKDDGARIEAWFVQGSIARSQGDPAQARELWDRALERAADRTGDGSSLALHLNLGMVEDGLGRPDAALEHYLAALPLAQARHDGEALVILLINIGHVLLARAEADGAAPLLARAARLAEESGDRRLHAYALEGVAACELARGQPELARSLAAQALAAAREWGEPALQVEAAATHADAEVALGRTTEAERIAAAAVRLAQRHGDVPGGMRSAFVLARAVGPAEPVALDVVSHLARDPRAPGEVRTAAAALAETWGANPSTAPADADAWTGLLHELVTGR